MSGADSLIKRLLPGLPTRRVRHAAKMSSLEIISQPGFSRFIGLLAQSKLPAPVTQAAIRWYIRYFNVDTNEMEHPPEAYKSFDEFFTRSLKPGVHTICDDPATLVSPVDGRVLNFGQVAEGHIDQIKGRAYRVAELLDSDEAAARFALGHYVTLYLSPRDYHRIHSPADGRITGFRYVPGRLYPVNDLGVNNVEKLFASNERLITYMETEHGELAVVKVGATNVGMITAAYHSIRTNVGLKTSFGESLRRKIPIKRGEELGVFHLGSTVVVLTERTDVAPIALSEGQALRMGQPLMKAGN